MPIYEYQCSRCGATIEVLLPASKVPSKCPKCGAAKLVRKFSSFTTTRGKTPGCTPQRG
jgi:putative FmdB family regulatory protein